MFGKKGRNLNRKGQWNETWKRRIKKVEYSKNWIFEVFDVNMHCLIGSMHLMDSLMDCKN